MNIPKTILSDITYFVPSSDRYIRVVEDEFEVIGIAYGQGDDLEYFKEKFYETDEDLTDFFNALECNLKGDTQLDRIDNAIWCYHNYEVIREERAYAKVNKEKFEALQAKHE